MKTRLAVFSAAAMLACMSQGAWAATAANPVAGIPVLGSLLAGLTSLPASGSAGMTSLSSVNGSLLPALPLGTLAAPLSGLPTVGPMLVTGANNLEQSLPELVNLTVSLVANLPGLAGSVVGLIPADGSLPAGFSLAALSDLPTTVSAASTNVLQALNGASAQYGLPALPTTLPGL